MFIKKWRFHSYGWMDIAIITKVAQSVERLHPHVREDVDTTRQLLRCQWRSGPQLQIMH